AGGGPRSQSETCVGCIVSCTTASSCTCSWFTSTSVRRIAPKVASVLPASCVNTLRARYLRWEKRRSLSDSARVPLPAPKEREPSRHEVLRVYDRTVHPVGN